MLLRSIRAALLAAACALAACSDPVAPPAFGDRDMQPAAGFLGVESASYVVHAPAGDVSLTSSAARLWYAFQPADHDPEHAPLLVMFNGGPGASSGILFAFNTAPMSFDDAHNGGASVGPSPASFTRFANLLYIDARVTGFSYGLLDDAADAAAREADLTVQSYNPYVDAADFARALLRFFDLHPALEGSRIALVGESYGGTRASILAHMLRQPAAYAGASIYEDAALVRAIEDRAPLDVGAMILLQPAMAPLDQHGQAGALFEADDSPLHAIADETGVPFVPCKDLAGACDPYLHAREYLASADRDIYDTRRPDGWLLERYDAVASRFVDPALLAKALAVEPRTIAALYAGTRAGAYRVAAEEPVDEPLMAASFGALAPWDRYYEMLAFDTVKGAFYGDEASLLGVHHDDRAYGRLFLEDARAMRVFVTNAAHDLAVYMPAFPRALAAYDDVVAGVDEAGGELTVRYVDGATAAIRFPRYEGAGHSVTIDASVELGDDIAAWLAEDAR